jgi:hypothetical protein
VEVGLLLKVSVIVLRRWPQIINDLAGWINSSVYRTFFFFDDLEVLLLIVFGVAGVLDCLLVVIQLLLLSLAA